MRSRDHTEIALREFGADLQVKQRVITLQGRPKLTGRELIVPSDLSSAAFFLVAGLLVPGSQLVIQNVGLNPTRSALLDFLLSIGAPVKVLRIESVNGELIGDIEVRYAPVRGGVIEKELDGGADRRNPRAGGAGRGFRRRARDSRCAGTAHQRNRPHRNRGRKLQAHGH